MAVYIDGIVGCKRIEQARNLYQIFTDSPFIHKIENKHHDSVKERDQLFWIGIIPKGIGLGVPYDTSDDRERYRSKRGEIVAWFYDTLRARNDFEIALFGWEAGDNWFDPEGETFLVDTVRFPDTFYPNGGLVVANKYSEPPSLSPVCLRICATE